MDKKLQKSCKKWVTIDLIAKHFECCEKTFRKYVKRYKIPHIRLGRQLRFNISEVEAFLRQMIANEQNRKARNILKRTSKLNKTTKKSNKAKQRYANLLGLG